jgi:DeoR family transcriptional regulator, suf operon transcriptional repressor
MQTTKGQILGLLKRRARQTVDGLAEELGLAPMTIRQHLTSLERDGFVTAETERQAKGRPHYVYSLTSKGENTFPKRYDRLAAQMLEEIGRLDPVDIADLSPAERSEYVLDRIADRIVRQHLTRLRGCSTEERVREVAAILQEESGFVEWSKTDGGYEIVDYNCIYRTLTETQTSACTWHQRIIGDLVALPPEAGGQFASGGTCCRYIVQTCDEDRQPGNALVEPRLGQSGQKITQEVH